MPSRWWRKHIKGSLFGLSLDGQAANWYSQHDITEFNEFEQLKEQIVQLFHRRIPQRELMSQFYAIA